MGDDAAGPYVIQVLKARCEFAEDVSVLDLGTPGLDLMPYIRGVEALVVVDTVHAEGAAGEIRTYRREAILSRPLQPRLNPHDPGLHEALYAAEFAGDSPEVLLVGVIPERTGTGIGLSDPVRAAIEPLAETVLEELRRLGVAGRPRLERQEPEIWWER